MGALFLVRQRRSGGDGARGQVADERGDAVAFFFQAEEGIGGSSVAGVQTCALPICRLPARKWRKTCSVRRPADTHPARVLTSRLRARRRPIATPCLPERRMFRLRNVQRSAATAPDRKSVV